MAKYSVPPNTGKVRVVMGLAGKYAVWNGKQGKNEFRIFCRTKKQAEEVAKRLNAKDHDGSIEVWS
jgi:hypothetical protein